MRAPERKVVPCSAARNFSVDIRCIHYKLPCLRKTWWPRPRNRCCCLSRGGRKYGYEIIQKVREFILAGRLSGATPIRSMRPADARWWKEADTGASGNTISSVPTVRAQSRTPAIVGRSQHFERYEHHKGDRAHSESVVAMINSLSPDFVCFTGDIMEEGKFLLEALEVLAGVKAPMYGVPGNHDYWSRVPFDGIIKCFAATGGAWLLNEERLIAEGKINLIGVAHLGPKHPIPPAKSGMKNILLFHYPAWAKEFGDQKFDLMLAGHSHGCQVRIPFYGPVMTPYAVDEYDLGLFQTKSGPLYVTSGIGWYPIPVRFNCRPEIVLVEI